LIQILLLFLVFVTLYSRLSVAVKAHASPSPSPTASLCYICPTENQAGLSLKAQDSARLAGGARVLGCDYGVAICYYDSVSHFQIYSSRVC
ncbi:hypothetical protein BKA70DRAFT_1268939, partial [Coprinopsis sp. MPI-PUGE-AT-0042]